MIGTACWYPDCSALPCRVPVMSCPLQKAKEDVSHSAKKAAISAESAADSAKHETKGFGARLWGRSQVRGERVVSW